jgi:hypothetical protein
MQEIPQITIDRFRRSSVPEYTGVAFPVQSVVPAISHMCQRAADCPIPGVNA